MKNNAILKAGKISPTRGTRIEGKNAAAIFTFLLKFRISILLILIILIYYCI